MSDFSAIFQPITIKRTTIKNRIVMPPIGSNFATLNGEFVEEHIQYYEQRAKGGTGLIILENVCIDFPYGTNGTTQLRIDNDQYIPGLYRFTERLHKHGAAVAVQINHAGASAFPGRLNGLQAISASNIPSKTGGAIPRPATKDEILHIVKQYGAAAHRAQRAGFDAVEIHAGHSYLLSQFLSPLFNNRTDEFGGSHENRARIIRMVIDEIRQSVGPFFPIIMRFSADDFIAGGNTLEDTLQILEYLTDEVDIFDVSSAQNDTLQFQIDQMNLPDGWRSYMAKAVRDKFNKPTITSGNFRDPYVVAKTLEEGTADFVVIGRGLIAEPYWVEKVKNGELDTLRRCISCNIGCADHRIAKAKPIRCTVNPDIVSYEDYKNYQVKKPLNVVVIGGGTAGLEAASTAAEIGCNVTLFEAKPFLGGLSMMISRFPYKKRIADLPKFLINRAKTLKNLTIHLNKKATLEDIEKLSPDLVISATGSKPLLPPIKGLSEQLTAPNRKVFSIFDIMENFEQFTDIPNKRIVVIGGGAVGLDVVEYFSESKAKDVSIVEMQSVIGKDLDIIGRISMMTMMKENKVNQLVDTTLLEVKENSFLVKDKEGKQSELPFDYGFVCLGMTPENSFSNTIEQHAAEKGYTFEKIGDSRAARKLIEGMREGRDIIASIQRIERVKAGEVRGVSPVSPV
ncbi:NAD(P)/FAD-dependent oxidoreductase [Zophobihabitans entericus]|uniref:FAD-dependent oxidoreductase n=1 Tax=Zophobihabitans entericus TaxID=1635327 RepID=A0A6G9I7P1_9GAMM|nr:NAD(P)/FAD-dependent oxidoreductase [Zophobihabitans entericus]QIQ20228.1 FAD-dependent oxidoreductase [Zophobihabitans entericus]